MSSDRVDNILDAARRLRAERYADAVAVFAAGSIVRGEATANSDLDLVVVHARLPTAYRESFTFESYPVEAFVHDPETLNYFFLEMDRPSGTPALPQMVAEGVEIPAPSEASRSLKALAARVLEMGPPALTSDEEQRRRYFVSDLVDDLRDPRSLDELVATGARLIEQLADYYLRSRGRWSGEGKSLTRALRRDNPDLAGRYARAFDALFSTSDATAVIALADEILAPHGGRLFDGYRAEAPAAWRKPQ